MILDCTDPFDSVNVLLEVGAADDFVIQLDGAALSTTLVGVEERASRSGYDLETADGRALHVMLERNEIDFVLDIVTVKCDATAARLDTARLDALVQATAASRAKQQPFASCQVGNAAKGPASGATAVTVRPALSGAGAILEEIEETDETDGDTNLVLFAKSLSTDRDGVTYKGDGGQNALFAIRVTHLSTLTASGAAGAATLSWNLDSDASTPRDPVRSTSCNITGDAIAKSLIGPP